MVNLELPNTAPAASPTMSSTVAKGQSAPVPETKTRYTLQPVAINDTPLSKAISIGRTPLLLSALFVRLPALIKDPVSTLQTALPFVVAIQIFYAVVCLPVAGSQQAKPTKKPRPGEKKKSETIGPNLVLVSYCTSYHY